MGVKAPLLRSTVNDATFAGPTELALATNRKLPFGETASAAGPVPPLVKGDPGIGVSAPFACTPYAEMLLLCWLAAYTQRATPPPAGTEPPPGSGAFVLPPTPLHATISSSDATKYDN